MCYYIYNYIILNIFNKLLNIIVKSLHINEQYYYVIIHYYITYFIIYHHKLLHIIK